MLAGPAPRRPPGPWNCSPGLFCCFLNWLLSSASFGYVGGELKRESSEGGRVYSSCRGGLMVVFGVVWHPLPLRRVTISKPIPTRVPRMGSLPFAYAPFHWDGDYTAARTGVKRSSPQRTQSAQRAKQPVCCNL